MIRGKKKDHVLKKHHFYILTFKKQLEDLIIVNRSKAAIEGMVLTVQASKILGIFQAFQENLHRLF